MKKIKTYNYLIFSFIISLIIICTIYKLQDVAPLGRNSLLKIDFFHQYGPMLAELFDRIKQKETLIYSFNIGLGIPFFRNFFNYLSSPFNIIILLFKRENLIMSYSILIAFKAILSACTMTYYLKQKLKSNKYTLIGLGLLYAFSAYFSAYYWNIMWTDGMIFLPLIVLGIENIINKNNGMLYTISLTLMMYTNYFIAYMICIFSVIYFISYLLIKKEKIKNIVKHSIKFSICSIIAGLLMAWELIPMFDALLSTNATTGSMPTNQYYYFTIIEFIKNHITGVTPTVLASGITNSPNVSCGILSISLYTLFLLNNKIKIRKKIIYTLLLLLLLCSFYIGPLDYIWHAFHVPNDLPYRYSFIYSFILLVGAGYSLKYIKDIPFIKVLISFISIIIFLTIIKLTNFENITDKMLTINYILIITYFLIYTLYHFYPKYKKTSIILFLTVISLECIISINHNWNILQYIDEFYKSYNDINTSIKIIKENDNELFYRTEKNKILTLNDGAWFDYYGITTFSSMAYNNIATLMNDLGQPGNTINSYYYKQNTPIYDLMFNIKYTIGDNKDTKRYEKVLDKNGTETYQFKHTTGLLFAVNNSIKTWKYNYINPLEYQNDFIKNSTNIENVLYRLTLKNKKIIKETDNETIVKFNYINEFDNIYLYTNNSLVNYIIIDKTLYYKNYININDVLININNDIEKYETYDEKYIINSITDKDNVEIIVSYSTYLNEEIDVYTINNEKFIKAYNILNNNKVILTNFKENKIEGYINNKNYSTIYTSIPFDLGWKVYVNGKRVKTFSINDSLLGFDVNKGENKIILKYSSNITKIGIAISLSTLIFSIAYLTFKKTNHQLD